MQQRTPYSPTNHPGGRFGRHVPYVQCLCGFEMLAFEGGLGRAWTYDKFGANILVFL